MTAAKTPAQRQAARKAREIAAGRVRWATWVHRDDVAALKACALRLAEIRDLLITSTVKDSLTTHRSDK